MSIVSWGCSINKFFSNCYMIDYYYHKYASINYFQNDIKASSVQFSRSVVSDSLWPHERQHARHPCPSPSPAVCPSSCLLNKWYHPTISSCVASSSCCPQYLLPSRSLPMSQLFTSGGQSIGISASASMSVLPMSIQCWFPLRFSSVAQSCLTLLQPHGL